MAEPETKPQTGRGTPELVFGCDCPAGHCLDTGHHAFWEPENWPGGQAPCRWVYTDREDKRLEDDRRVERAIAEGGPAVRNRCFISDDLSVDCWIPEYVPSGPFGVQMWWASQSAAHYHPSHIPAALSNIRAWIRMERELDAELTPFVEAHRDLEELRAVGMAVPG